MAMYREYKAGDAVLVNGKEYVVRAGVDPFLQTIYTEVWASDRDDEEDFTLARVHMREVDAWWPDAEHKWHLREAEWVYPGKEDARIKAEMGTRLPFSPETAIAQMRKRHKQAEKLAREEREAEEADRVASAQVPDRVKLPRKSEFRQHHVQTPRKVKHNARWKEGLPNYYDTGEMGIVIQFQPTTCSAGRISVYAPDLPMAPGSPPTPYR